MTALTLVFGTIAIGAAACTAWVLARYMPANPTGRKLRVGVYALIVVAGVVRVVQTLGSKPGMALFYAAATAFFGALAYAAAKSPSLE